MNTRNLMTLILLALALPSSGRADSSHSDRSKYAGLETREIKSLSAVDIRELSEGHGWGLSLVAELNGVPGPRHLLDMKDELGLSAEQVGSIEEIYRRMKSEAVTAGRELIRLERELDASFANGTIDKAGLGVLLDSIARTRRDLRYVHLAAHLETPPLLSEDQIGAYSRLRGYDAADPCSAVPPGHDAAMWRKHNGCEG